MFGGIIVLDLFVDCYDFGVVIVVLIGVGDEFGC